MSAPAETRRCFRCHEERDVSLFGWKCRTCDTCKAAGPSPSLARPRVCHRCWEERPWVDYEKAARICNHCREAGRQEALERHERRRVATMVNGDIVERRCPDCREVKRLDAEHFYRDTKRTKQTGREEFMRVCKGCQRRRVSERRRRRMVEDPDGFRADRRKWQRAWADRNPDKIRAYERAYRERVKADPRRRRAALEAQRMQYRLRRERREGISLDEVRAGRVRDVGRDVGGDLPLAPLAAAVIAWIDEQRPADFDWSARDHSHLTDTVFAERLGISPRRLYEWRHGNAQEVRLNVADGCLVVMDKLWWEVWPPEEYPDAVRVWTGESEAAAA